MRSARVVDGRLPRGAAGTARRRRGGPESDEHRATDGGVGRRLPDVPAPGPVRMRLRVRVGRRDPLQHPAGRGPAVHAGDTRGACGRDEGAGGARGRLSGERGKLGQRAAGPARTRPARAGGGDWRRRARILVRGARRVAGDDAATRLVPQDGERARQAPQASSAAGQAALRESCMRRPGAMPRRPSAPSLSSSRRSIRRRRPAWWRTRRRCWRSSTFRRSTGGTCGRRI